MPALPPAPNCVLVRVKGIYGTSIFNNVLHLQYTGGAPTTADLSTLATSINSAWTTNFAPLMPIGVNVTGIDLADLTNPAAAAGSFTVTSTGSRAGTIMNAATACCVSWIINSRYRGGHPRTYFPFGVAGDTGSTRTWSSAFQTTVNNAANAFRTALNAITISGTTYKMIALSYKHNNEMRDQPVPYTINSNVTHGRIDTQRRRLGKETP